MIEYLTKLIHGRRDDEERGASAVEYGLLIAGIAAIIVVAVMALGPVVKNAFTSTCSSITTENTSLLASGESCSS